MIEMEERTRCRHCGHIIWAEDITRYRVYERLFGPSFVYVKAECPECKDISEYFVKQEQWEKEYDLPTPPSPFAPSGGA